MRDHRRVRSSWIGLGLAASALGACAPLAQAPLVYSSKSSFGLDVSATSTETPGISFSIGSKQVDAAYVPVAVAIPCAKPATTASGGAGLPPASCTGELHKLVQITGRNNLSNSSSPTAVRYQEARTALEEATKDFNDAKRRRDEAAKKLADDTELAKGYVPPTDAPAPADQAAVADQAAAAEDDQTQEKARAHARLAQDKRDNDDAEAKLSAAGEKVKGAQRELEAAASTRATSDITTLEDSYSVFGTFDGKGDTTAKTTASTTTTGAPGQPGAEAGKSTTQTVQGPSLDASGGLHVGKMFSTGIASQHLAAAAKLQSLSDCMEKTAITLKEINALTGIDNALKAKMVELAAGYCPAAYRAVAVGREGQ